MKTLRTLGSALLLTSSLSLAVGALPAVAGGEVTYDACVVERHPTAALMRLEGDIALFELDLRPIPGQPFALNPDECVTVTGIDRDNEPGLRREFPRASWLVEATQISSVKSQPPSRRGKQDD